MKRKIKLSFKSLFAVVSISLLCMTFTGCITLNEFCYNLTYAILGIEAPPYIPPNENESYRRTKEYREWYNENARKIMNVLDYNKSHITDINHDGIINCQDFSISYYFRWKELYPDMPIELVYNSNVKGTPHLFVRVYANNKWNPEKTWFYIEPQHAPGGWRVEETWGDSYDYKLNEYGGTERWLKQWYYSKK